MNDCSYLYRRQASNAVVIPWCEVAACGLCVKRNYMNWGDRGELRGIGVDILVSVPWFRFDFRNSSLIYVATLRGV